ncbi:MAG: glycosyltransferase family 2 protein [Lachnospiraceae bacterium]|jgi:GT2 family glycosyltransferase|nr:glycosyltransferase family 2 protein [Lachnospiraceae bacterium]
MRENKHVSVVIPNYNGIQYMEVCLEALAQQLPPEQIIVVDNGSTDGSREWVARHWPEVRLICLDQNYGFCRGVNEGIRAADTSYVILLNNDTKVCPGFVRALEEALMADAGAFSAGAKMLQYDRPDRIDDAGNLYCALGWAFARGKDKPASLYEKPEQVFAACAGAAIYRRGALEQLGFFDEKHFAYLEDMDVGYRARIHGWRNLYEPRAKVYHVGSGTSGSRYNEFKVFYSTRNNIYLIYKNMPWLQIGLNLPFLLAGFGIKYLFFVRRGLGKTYGKGLMAGFSLCRRQAKVKFCWKNLPNYGKIQVALWRNLGKRLG